jgi:hypothetical protein
VTDGIYVWLTAAVVHGADTLAPENSQLSCRHIANVESADSEVRFEYNVIDVCGDAMSLSLPDANTAARLVRALSKRRTKDFQPRLSRPCQKFDRRSRLSTRFWNSIRSPPRIIVNRPLDIPLVPDAVHKSVHKRFLVTQTSPPFSELHWSAAFLTTIHNGSKPGVPEALQLKLEREFSWHKPK